MDKKTEQQVDQTMGSDDPDNVLTTDCDDDVEEVGADSSVEEVEVPNISVAEVKIELDDNLKSKLVADLSSICSIDEPTAREMLARHKWNMQRAIDNFFDNSETDDGENNQSADSDVVVCSEDIPVKTEPEVVNLLGDSDNPQEDSKGKEGSDSTKPATSTASSPAVSSDKFTKWAPEKLSVISWNLDGLDDKNLEKRTDAVIETILREKHDVVFFQELLPYTFDYIARRICSQYMPIPGTEDPACEYLTATFLKLNQLHYEDHYILPYPNTAMQRNLLVTKAFVGRAKIALLNTHLESTAEFSEQRKEQLRICFDIAKSFQSDYNVLFGGDLNLRDKEVIGLLPMDFCDLWVKCGSRSSCQYTWDLTRNTNTQMPSKYQPKCRFDRFYFRPSNPSTLSAEFFGVTGIEKVVGTQSFPSDHWAIITFFKLSMDARRPMGVKRKAETEEVAV